MTKKKLKTAKNTVPKKKASFEEETFMKERLLKLALDLPEHRKAVLELFKK